MDDRPHFRRAGAEQRDSSVCFAVQGDLLKLKSPGPDPVVELAELCYETSKLATARRIVDLYDKPSAIILSWSRCMSRYLLKEAAIAYRLLLWMSPKAVMTTKRTNAHVRNGSRVFADPTRRVAEYFLTRRPRTSA